MAVEYYETAGHPMLRLEGETGVHVSPPTGTALEVLGWERTSAGDGRMYWFPPRVENEPMALAGMVDRLEARLALEVEEDAGEEQTGVVVITDILSLARAIISLTDGHEGECLGWLNDGDVQPHDSLQGLVDEWMTIGCTYSA